MVYQEVFLLTLVTFTVSLSKLVGNPQLLTEFTNFMDAHGKNYGNEEEKALRLEVFQRNLKRIEELNAEAGCGVEYAVNQFADLTRQEFRANYLGLKKSGHTPPAALASLLQSQKAALPKEIPTEFDWRKISTAFPPVLDQDTPHPCGSCYTFGTVGILDILYSKEVSNVTYFSKQQVVDCGENFQCQGGSLNSSLTYMQDIGVVLESEYPYVAQNQSCAFKPGDPRPTLKIKNHYLALGEPAIQAALPNSPIVIAMNASSLRFYKKGILDPSEQRCSKDPESVSHAVMVIGMGKDEKCKTDYWIVRNSWGNDWGEDGYFRIKKGVNACAIGLSENFGIELDKEQVLKFQNATRKKTKV